MTIKIGTFEIPKRLIKDEETATNTYARFIAEPLESGYARTIGNSLRRVLLSSLEGAAVSSLKLAGAHHEFCSIPGVLEDVTDIILNLKKVLFRVYSRDAGKVTIKFKGPGEVTAGDIKTDHMIEVLNPSHYIATVAEDGKLDAEMTVSVGRGFRMADTGGEAEREIGVVSMDCLFSPVRRVNFSVENMRVGRRTDYEKLVLDIETDERITPDDALVRAAIILRHHLDVFVNYDEETVEFDETAGIVDQDKEELFKKLDMSVNEIELTVRAANCLNNANILTVGELASKTEAEMLKYRNFGKKSLNEIKNKLAELGLSLGTKLDDYPAKKG